MARGVSGHPRHVFVPGFYDQRDSTPQWIDAQNPAWLPAVYFDDSLITQLQRHPDDAQNWWPTSSSSRPSLMVSMLEALDMAEGMRVLEIGTGTGYNAALLSARLGADRVVSVDIDSGLVDAARNRLAQLGHRPVLAVLDGTGGYPEGAPYDRVIATHSVERVPYAWVTQTRPGGTILVDVRSVGTAQVGHLARLTVHEDGTATGDFHSEEPGFFMPVRLDAATPNRRFLAARDLRAATSRSSDVGAHVLKEPGLAFALWTHLPEISVVSMGPQTLVFTTDGSEVPRGFRTGIQ